MKKLIFWIMYVISLILLVADTMLILTILGK